MIGKTSYIRAVILCGFLTLSPPITASPFSEAYSAYQAAIEQQDSAAAVKYAEQAYLLGKSYFEANSIDVAHLELNWATALQDNEQNALAYDHFNSVIATYRQRFGKDAIELIDPLIGAADTVELSKETKLLFGQAIDIAEDANKPLLLAEVQMLAFNKLASTAYYTRDVRDYAIDALEIYQTELPADAMARLKATFYVGMVKAAESKTSLAIEYLEEVVKQFAVLNYSHPYKLAAHARLIELYEKKGDSDSSTQHCIAIGSMKPWSETQNQTPLFRLAPRYPISYARDGKEGWTQMSFTVDEQGFVKDPVVIASEGGKLFTKESLKAIKRWRYAPKFVDGQPVAAEATVQLEYSLSP